MFVVEEYVSEQNFRMLPDHRKILPVLLLNTTQVSNILEGGKTFQIEQNLSKLATLVVVIPAPAGWALSAKVLQKSDRNSAELKLLQSDFSFLTNYLNAYFRSHDEGSREITQLNGSIKYINSFLALKVFCTIKIWQVSILIQNFCTFSMFYQVVYFCLEARKLLVTRCATLIQ